MDDSLDLALRKLMIDSMRENLTPQVVREILVEGVRTYIHEDLSIAAEVRKTVDDELHYVLALAAKAPDSEPTLKRGRLYSVKDAAQILSVSRDYVYSAIRAGQLPTIDLAMSSRRKFRISGDSLIEYIDRRRSA